MRKGKKEIESEREMDRAGERSTEAEIDRWKRWREKERKERWKSKRQDK